MPDPLVPYGYRGTMLTWSQMEGMATFNRLEPEFQRRFKAMSIDAARQDVKLGVGTGWRIQPDPPPPGFAKPGNSNHEGFEPGGVWAVAIDTVPETGWDWMHANCEAYGLRDFRNVNNEPWHVQPSDIPASRSYRKERWHLPPWPLPDEEDDMPLSDEDVKRIARAVWAETIDTTAAEGIEPQPARRLLHRTFLIMQQCVGSFNGKAPPAETMLERIDRNTKE